MKWVEKLIDSMCDFADKQEEAQHQRQLKQIEDSSNEDMKYWENGMESLRSKDKEHKE